MSPNVARQEATAKHESHPKLSVVIPVYTERATIEEVLRRVQQVALDKEIIIVDDGSTDGTREFLQQLASASATSGTPILPGKSALQRKNIRVFFHDHNQGKGGGFTRGLFQAAREDIILIQPRFENTRSCGVSLPRAISWVSIRIAARPERYPAVGHGGRQLGAARMSASCCFQ